MDDAKLIIAQSKHEHLCWCKEYVCCMSYHVLELLVPVPIGFRPVGDLMENLGIASYPLESVVASGRVDLDVHPVSWRLDLAIFRRKTEKTVD